MTLIACITCVAGAILLTLFRVFVSIFGSLLWGCLAIVKWSVILSAVALAVLLVVEFIQPTLDEGGIAVASIVTAAFLWMVKPITLQ